MDGGWLISYVALWLLVLLLVILLLGLTREVGGLHSRIGPPGVLATDDGLDIGALAPDFTTTEVPGGGEVHVRAASGRDALVLFISPNCELCRKVLPTLAKSWAAWQRVVNIHVVCEGTEEEVRSLIDQTKAQISMLADPSLRIRTAYGLPPAPFAFLIGSMGMVRLKGLVTSGDDIDRLVEGRGRAPGGRELLARPEPEATSEEPRIADPIQSPAIHEGVAYERAV